MLKEIIHFQGDARNRLLRIAILIKPTDGEDDAERTIFKEEPWPPAFATWLANRAAAFGVTIAPQEPVAL